MNTIITISTSDFNYLETLILDKVCSTELRNRLQVKMNPLEESKKSKKNVRFDKSDSDRVQSTRLLKPDRCSLVETTKNKTPSCDNDDNSTSKLQLFNIWCLFLLLVTYKRISHNNKSGRNLVTF